jgi:hypothetical protein
MVIKYLHIILGIRYFVGRHSHRLNIAITGSDSATGLSICLRIIVFCVAAIDESLF